MEKTPFTFFFTQDQVVNKQDFRRFERLICPICQNLLHMAQRCSDCSTHYCQNCIESWLKKSSSCPNCRCAIKLEKIEKTMKEDLEDCLLKCCFEGCSQVVKYEILQKHEIECDFHPISCHWCNFTNLQKDVRIHQKVCENRQEICEICNSSVHYAQIIEHRLNCYKNKLSQLQAENMKLLKNSHELIKAKKLKFSNNLLYKHEDIQVLSPTICSMKSDIPRISGTILMKPKLKPRLCKASIRILSIGCWIALGVGNGTVLARNKYVLNDYQVENMQHGSYLVSNNGLRWSCDNGFENNKGNNGFLVGDIINICFDREKMTVNFSVENKGYLDSLTIKKNFLENSNYFVAVLGGIKDMIEIVGYKFE